MLILAYRINLGFSWNAFRLMSSSYFSRALQNSQLPIPDRFVD
jgi:hypothetical protein